MAIRKPKIVIIGAGMAGLAAATRLRKSPNLLDLSVVDGGSRIGGRIHSSEFAGDPIELGATFIHGIQGSPIYEIAYQSNLLQSHRPWEAMDGWSSQDFVTVAEGGHVLNRSMLEPISRFFNTLIHSEDSEIVKDLLRNWGPGDVSVGDFIARGFQVYLGLMKDRKGGEKIGNWSREKLERSIFAMHENIQRSISGADDLGTMDYRAEKEYTQFPGKDITIARGYSSVIESMESKLPVGTIQLCQKVEKIEWQLQNGSPVKLHFADGSIMSADHAIVTVSLGVLKRGVGEGNDMFDPPLPGFKVDAISRLGYGVVDKVFLQVSSENQEMNIPAFPNLQMVFHDRDSDLRSAEIPHWIRKTPLVYPLYRNSRVVVSWFTGQEALEVETLSEEEIVDGFSATISNLLPSKMHFKSCNGNVIPPFKFQRALTTRWGSDPLFLGSYSYVPVGSSGDDYDAMAQPLPLPHNGSIDPQPQLQIMFAGEATHRTHYSTTHGAYLSGLREADRLLKHYGL